MAVEIGTASNHQDLMLKLEKFLTSNPALVAANQQWEVKKDNVVNPYTTNTTANADANGYSLHRFFIGHGLDGQDNIIVPMVLRHNTSLNYYTMTACAARAYVVDKGVSDQLTDNVHGARWVTISLWHTDMKYWFIANGRRFIIVVKVSNRYATMYCGFIKPSGTDLEYPYPLLIGGNHTLTDSPYTNDYTGTNRSFFNPQASGSGSSSSMIYTPSGRLCFLDNQGGAYVPTQDYLIGVTYPYHYNHYIGKTLDDEYVLLDIDIVQYNGGMNHLGWFDGVCFVTGFENSPENIITVGNERYICVSAMVQNDYNNWVAIKLE